MSEEPFVVPVNKPAADAAAAYAAAAPPDPDNPNLGIDRDEPVAQDTPPTTPEPPAAPAPEPPAPEAAGPAAEPKSAVQPDPEPETIDDLAARAAKADEYLGIAQRTQADFENFRKRARRDADLAQERGITKLAKALLPAIDNLDRAVQAAETWGSSALATDPATTAASGAAAGAPEGEESTHAAHEAQLHAGLRLVHAEVLAALARVGIEPFSPAGETFDPNQHEAVAQTPIEGAAPGTVAEVYQQGYRFGETVLRPARVLVAA